MALKGANVVLRNLNTQIGKIEGRTNKAILAAAALIKARSQEKTPVDEGNLKASHYTSRGDGSLGPIAEVGCTADYAIYVHEDLEANHPTGEAKFLEKAIKESSSDILKIIKDGVRVI